MANVVLLQPTAVKPPVKFGFRKVPPFALLTVAAPLLAKGYTVKIVDQRLNPDWERELVASIDNETFCLGISALTGRDLLYALQASRIVKLHTNVAVVWGGVHASLLPEQTVRHPCIDFVVQGEGDHALLALVRALAEGRDDYAIPGVWAKRNGSIQVTPPGPFLDLDSLPRIPFNLLDESTYNLGDVLFLFTSRGCAHRCGFCYNLQYCGSRWRGMRAERVLEDLRYYVKTYRPRKIRFRDDNFFQNPARVRGICEGIVGEGLKFRWKANCRIDQVCRMTDDDIDLLLASGFEDFGFGIESGAQRMLDIMRKDISVDQVLEAVSRLRERGILYSGTFVGGYPGETLEDLEKTIRFIGELSREDPSMTFLLLSYLPFPGTAAYDKLRAHGFRFPESVEGWADFNWPYDPAISSVGKAHSFYVQDTPWLSRSHRRRLYQAELLGQVAGRPIFRSRSVLVRLLALPYNLPILIARSRWVHGLWGPVPERHLYSAVRSIGLSLFRRLRRRSPTRQPEG